MADQIAKYSLRWSGRVCSAMNGTWTTLTAIDPAPSATTPTNSSGKLAGQKREERDRHQGHAPRP